MAFKKITDYNKRDELVNEYLSLKDKYHERQLAERLGNEYVFEERRKQYQPLIKEIKEQKYILQKAIDNKPINQLAIEPADDSVFLGLLPQKYIGKKNSDQTFGVRIENGKFYIGDKQIEVVDNDIFIDNKPYKGTSGVWNLLMMKKPDDFTSSDYEIYKEIMKATGALRNPRTNRIKSNGGEKWKSILGRVAKEIYPKTKTITIPEDPDRLTERMDLLIQSKEAGNTGVDDELEAILKSMYEKNIINKDQLKELSDQYLS